MNKCPKCGSYIPEGGKMCIACGWKPEKNASEMDDNPLMKYMQDAFEKMSKNQEGIDEEENPFREQELAALGYVGPMFLYSLYKEKDSAFIRYHANQSLMLFALRILCDAFDRLPLVGKPMKKIAVAGIVVLAFLGARNAYSNKKEPVPYIGEYFINVIK